MGCTVIPTVIIVFILVWPTSWTPAAVGGLIVCESVRRHDERLIMKLCMYVGYYDANNVSHFGGDPVTQHI